MAPSQQECPRVENEDLLHKLGYRYPEFNGIKGFKYYTSKQFKTRLDKAGMKQSMSRVGHCIDNGPMEGFWSILKCEMHYLGNFKDY